MAFADILKFLYERAKDGSDEITSQTAFGAKHGVSRPTMNLWLNGKPVPPKTIWEILERENYNFEECIFLPDLAENLPKKHQVMIHRLIRLLELPDSDMPKMVKIAIDAWYTQQYADADEPPAPERKRGGK